MENKFIKVSLLFLFLFSSVTIAQISYSGPLAGGVTGGVTVSTNSFSRVTPISDPTERATRNIISLQEEPFYVDFGYPVPPEGSNIVGDLLGTDLRSGSIEQTIILNNFAGIPQTSSIPPDPYLTVGPNHIIATVNSNFAIWDKEGNLLKTINADSWFGSTIPGPGAFDPKVSYDHHSQRWFMVWLSQNDNTQTAYFLLSVSDDSDPLGTWYNWALPSTLNGTNITNTWGDYQGVGFDKDAIYITSNQFVFGGSFQYVKLRVVPKAQLYLNTAGPVNWQDIWNISRPGGGGLFTLRPSITYGEPTGYNLVYMLNGSANFVSVYTLTNPLTTPVLTGVNVPVTAYQSAPNANQLGGSSILLEGGGSAVRHEPTYRDGFLWLVHSVRNPSSPSHSSIHYIKVNVTNNTLAEDYVYGAPGYWHIYNHLAVDQNHNVAITFSRSGDNEYVGAYFVTRLANDPPGFESTYLLRPGMGNYVKDFNSGRNRWGDYNGIWLDPIDQNNFWLFTEYVAATNTWGTWVGKIRLVPFAGIYPYTNKNSIDFGNIELGFSSDTLSFILANYGSDDMTINSIPGTFGAFQLVSNLTYPHTLSSYDSLELKFLFVPVDTGHVEVQYPINNNSTTFSFMTLKAKGYVINPATDNVFYASSGSGNGGYVLSVDPLTGAGTNLGPSLFSALKSIAIHPTTKVMYGLVNSVQSSSIVRVNAEKGDAYLLFTVPIINMTSIVFDTSGTFYAFVNNGKLYELSLPDGNYIELLTIPINIAAVAVNPADNEFWVSRFALAGTNIDKIYKISILTGDTLFIGKAGTNALIQGMSFSTNGHLYGVIGGNNQSSRLLKIDQVTGRADTIGSVGLNNLLGLAFNGSTPTNIFDNNNKVIPSDFSLSQNYPNPFNPRTTIDFSLPKPADVKIIVYNLLGEVVNVILNKQMNAGVHKAVWNSEDKSGRPVSSGVYFYELRANSGDANDFQQIRKMVLLK